MILKDLFQNLDVNSFSSEIMSVDVRAVSSDSRRIVPGSLFVALAGPKTHGAQFISDAIQGGAVVIVHDKQMQLGLIPAGIITLPVNDPHRYLVMALRNFYRDPSRDIGLIGITGTNGKTTITYLLEALFAQAGKNCGVIGTVNHRYQGQVIKAANTTPGLVENYDLLSKMVAAKVDYCAMEVSSHALDQKRVDGLDFRYAIFTNLTSDHLDYHKDRDTYFRAKAKLFTALTRASRAVVNIDDEYGPRLCNMISTPKWSYGIRNLCDVTAQKIELTFQGTQFLLTGPGGQIQIQSQLIGMHNIYNMLSVAAVAMSEKIPLDVIKQGLESLRVVPGRLERIEAGQSFHVFVDYAHTEDALKNVLSSLRQVSQTKIIVVFGCGGDRDKTKRPKMAAVVEQWADFAIITTDNPRSEDPQTIVNEIVGGFKHSNYEIVLDREQAIAQALKMARESDVVLIAGKGHEDYQIFKDRTVAFDERQVVRKLIASV